MRPAHYEITVEGRLPGRGLAEFAGLTARRAGDTTILDGVIGDQAALVGTVVRIEALGGRVRGFRPTSLEDRSDVRPGA